MSVQNVTMISKKQIIFTKVMMTEVALKYIRIFKSNINADDFLLCLNSSPFYPTLLSLYNTFKIFGFKCKLAKTDINSLVDLKGYILIRANINNHWEMLLVKISENKAHKIYNPKIKKYQSITIAELQKVWDGVVLYTDLSSNFLQLICQNLRQYSSLIFIAIVLIFLFFFKRSFAISILALNIIGLLLAHFLLNPNTLAFSSFCKRGSYIDCEKVAKSSYSNVLGLPLSIYASAYFSSFLSLIVISILILPRQSLSLSFTAMGQISALISPIVLIYSIVSQVRIKKVCIYCMLVLLILIINVILFLPFLKYTFSTYAFLMLFSILFLVFIYLWFKVQSFMLVKQKMIYNQLENLTIKRSEQYLKINLNKRFDQNDFLHGLKIHSVTKEKIRVGLWVSTKCDHCLKAMQELEKLSFIIPDYFSLIIFPLEINKNDINYNEFIDTIIRMWININSEEITQKEVENRIFRISKDQLRSIYDKYQINELPTMQIEDYFLPAQYRPEELKYLLLDWSNYFFN